MAKGWQQKPDVPLPAFDSAEEKAIRQQITVDTALAQLRDSLGDFDRILPGYSLEVVGFDDDKELGKFVLKHVRELYSAEKSRLKLREERRAERAELRTECKMIDATLDRFYERGGTPEQRAQFMQRGGTFAELKRFLDDGGYPHELAGYGINGGKVSRRTRIKKLPDGSAVVEELE